MQSALHLKTKVLPGHKIEIQSDNLEIGDTVDVFIVISENKSKDDSSVVNLISKMRSNRLSFKTSEQIDQQIREERESWDIGILRMFVKFMRIHQSLFIQLNLILNIGHYYNLYGKSLTKI